MKHVLLSLLLVVGTNSSLRAEEGSPAVVGEESLSLVAVWQDGNEINGRIYQLLREFKFPHTFGTNSTEDSTLVELVSVLEAEILSWGEKAEQVLETVDAGNLSASSLLPVLYFSLVTKILQIKELQDDSIPVREIKNKYKMIVPVEVFLRGERSFQEMLNRQRVVVVWQEGQATLYLQSEFISGLKTGVAALNPSSATHLQASKHLLYSILYSQYVQNEHYQGETRELDKRLLKKIPFRSKVIDNHRNSFTQALMRTAITLNTPQLAVPADGLAKPLHAEKNWQLVKDFREKYPHFQTFTNQEFATRLHPLVDAENLKPYEVTDAVEFERFLTTAEFLLFPRALTNSLKNMSFTLSDDEESLQGLAQIIVQAKRNTILSVLRQLRIRDRNKLLALNSLLKERQADIQEDGKFWYEIATKNLPTLKKNTRLEMIRNLSSVSKQIKEIETYALKPVLLPILNRSLLRSFHVNDFSEEYQQTTNKIISAKNYNESRRIFFQELTKHLTRLNPDLKKTTILKLSPDDITKNHLLEVLDKKEDNITTAVTGKAKMHHVSQSKSLLQFGHWLGFFNYYENKTPTIDDLPLTELQRENYLLELKFSFFDHYPFLILAPKKVADKKNKKKLHELLAENYQQDATDEESLENWQIISSTLLVQRDKIVRALKKVDKAKSVNDLKYILANSPTLNKEMRQYAGLYPLHKKFAERAHKPNGFEQGKEKLDAKYIGSFFMFLISMHLGEWLLAKHPSTMPLLRYTHAILMSNQIYFTMLSTAFFAGIIFEYVALETLKVFVFDPIKTKELHEYYVIGDRNNSFMSRTLLDYFYIDQKAQKLNYGFEGAMHGIFVGWFMYAGIFKHLIQPKISADKTQKLLKRVGIAENKAEVAKLFNTGFLETRTQKQIEGINNKVSEKIISEAYGRAQIKLILQAKKSLEKKITKTIRKIEVFRVKSGQEQKLSDNELLQKILGRQIYNQENVEIAIEELLINYEEAIMLSLIRGSKGTSSHTKLQEALKALNLPENFLQTVDFTNEQAVKDAKRIISKALKRQNDLLEGLYTKFVIHEKTILSDQKNYLFYEIDKLFKASRPVVNSAKAKPTTE